MITSKCSWGGKWPVVAGGGGGGEKPRLVSQAETSEGRGASAASCRRRLGVCGSLARGPGAGSCLEPLYSPRWTQAPCRWCEPGHKCVSDPQDVKGALGLCPYPVPKLLPGRPHLGAGGGPGLRGKCPWGPRAERGLSLLHPPSVRDS